MKAVTLDKFGGVEEMHWSDLPKPIPKSNEVQIEVSYAAVNPVDWKISNGLLKNVFDCEFPLIPGWDASGTVSAIGSEVQEFQPGDEVFCYCRKSTVQWGTYAEYVCSDAKHVAAKPKNLSFAEAAAIPLVSLTAWQALFDEAKLQKGQSVLIHAGAGGVGGIAIEFAKETGAKVFTTASARNHEYVQSLGADVAIDYHKESFVKKVKELQPEGVDVVLDCVGDQTLEDSFDVVKEGGHLVSIVNKVDPEKAKARKIHGHFMIVRPDGEQLKQIARWIEEGKVKTPNITEMPISDYAEALEKSKEGHTRGKIVLRISES